MHVLRNMTFISRASRFSRPSVRVCAAALLGLAGLALLPGPVVSPDADSLARHVVIRRDTFGVPHLLAESEEAAAFGLGYAQAEDHPLELVARCIRARGGAAAIFGAAELGNDLAMARFDNARLAREALAHEVSAKYRRVLEAYAAGVNHYIRQHRAELPDWVSDVSAADVLANGRAGAAQSAASPRLVAELKRKYDPSSRVQAPLPLQQSGSSPLPLPSQAQRQQSQSPSPLRSQSQLQPQPQPQSKSKSKSQPDPQPTTQPRADAEAASADRVRSVSTGTADGDIPFDPRDTPSPIEELREADGSNALAIAGARSASGKPMLLGNPHLRWQSRYWEAHITVPGRINFYGSTLVGLPTLRAGFNDRVGYVQTNNDPDLEDLFALPIDPASPTRYRVNGRSRALTRREVAIAVRQPDGSTATERREFWDSHLGPVIHRSATHIFVLRSEALNAWRYFEGFQELMPSRNLADFQARLRRALIPTSNFTYADADGHILYQWNARLPRRVDDGTSYALDVPGDTAKYVWSSVHPLADLPRLLDPPGGYIQNANNSPWWTSLRDRLDPSRYPASIERHPLALRPQRALQMLEARDTFSMEDVRALKFDTHVLLADRVLPDLFEAARAASPQTTDLARGAAILSAWNRRAEADSVGATLFFTFWDTYRAAFPPAPADGSAPEGGRQPFATPWSEQQPLTTPAGLADRPAAAAALERAVRTLREQHGSEAVKWGDVNRLRVGEIDLPADGADGGYGLYHVQRFDPVPGSSTLKMAGRFPADATASAPGPAAGAPGRPPSAAPAGAPSGTTTHASSSPASSSPSAGAGAAASVRAVSSPSARPFVLPDTGPGLAGFGDAWVLLVHFTQPVEARAVLAYGQTTRLESAHSRDQMRLFARHELRRVVFSEAEIQANLERSYRP